MVGRFRANNHATIRFFFSALLLLSWCAGLSAQPDQSANEQDIRSALGMASTDLGWISQVEVSQDQPGNTVFMVQDIDGILAITSYRSPAIAKASLSTSGQGVETTFHGYRAMSQPRGGALTWVVNTLMFRVVSKAGSVEELAEALNIAAAVNSLIGQPTDGLNTEHNKLKPQHSKPLADGSHLRHLAKKRFFFDLSGDLRMEEVLLIPSGTNHVGQFFSLMVLNEKGAILWSGPTELNSDNPLVFGEWHHGISMPELLGDIDGDGAIELITPAPQSDVSPTVFRVSRWRTNEFTPVHTSILLENPSGTGRFPWAFGNQSLGSWVSSFQSINRRGEITVNITNYLGGTDAKMRRAVLRGDSSGFILMKFLHNSDSNGAAVEYDANMPLPDSNSYLALLSDTDHVNSRNVLLSTVLSILQQDRANYHRYQRRDREDEGDSFFSRSADRASMKNMPVRSPDADWEQRILNGTPLVKVTVESGKLLLHILRD